MPAQVGRGAANCRVETEGSRGAFAGPPHAPRRALRCGCSAGHRIVGAPGRAGPRRGREGLRADLQRQHQRCDPAARQFLDDLHRIGGLHQGQGGHAVRRGEQRQQLLDGVHGRRLGRHDVQLLVHNGADPGRRERAVGRPLLGR